MSGTTATSTTMGLINDQNAAPTVDQIPPDITEKPRSPRPGLLRPPGSVQLRNSAKNVNIEKLLGQFIQQNKSWEEGATEVTATPPQSMRGKLMTEARSSRRLVAAPLLEEVSDDSPGNAGTASTATASESDKREEQDNDVESCASSTTSGEDDDVVDDERPRESSDSGHRRRLLRLPSDLVQGSTRSLKKDDLIDDIPYEVDNDDDDEEGGRRKSNGFVGNVISRMRRMSLDSTEETVPVKAVTFHPRVEVVYKMVLDEYTDDEYFDSWWTECEIGEIMDKIRTIIKNFDESEEDNGPAKKKRKNYCIRGLEKFTRKGKEVKEFCREEGYKAVLDFCLTEDEESDAFQIAKAYYFAAFSSTQRARKLAKKDERLAKAYQNPEGKNKTKS